MMPKTIAEKTAEKCIEKVAQNVLDQINWKGPYSTANRKDMIDIIQSAIDKAVELYHPTHKIVTASHDKSCVTETRILPVDQDFWEIGKTFDDLRGCGHEVTTGDILYSKREYSEPVEIDINKESDK